MTRVIVDRENVNDDFVVIRKIYKPAGAYVAADECILEVETSKTLRQIVSPESGTLLISHQEGQEVELGELLFEISSSGGKDTPNTPDSKAEAETVRSPADANPSVFSRAAIEAMRKLDIDIQSLPLGWVTEADVYKAAGGLAPRTASSAAGMGSSTAGPRFRVERKPPHKRTEARRLAQANSAGTNSMIGVEVALPGPRLVPPPFLFEDSITDIVVFEAARLLGHYPELNSHHIDERTVGHYEDVNFGISFDRGHDLKVLALCNAEKLSLSEVQQGIESLLDRYESNSPIEERLLTSSTVTLSDLSRTAANLMLPLLNSDQSMIIGITRRPPLTFDLHAAFDHRVSEGLRVAQFLGELKQRVESHFHLASATDHVRLTETHCSICGQDLGQESKLGSRGLIKVLLSEGRDGLLCRNCFEGW